MTRFLTRAAAAAAIALMATATTVHAQDAWAPPGPVRLMIAFAAGGGADTQARLIAEDIEEALGWSFIPEQVTGAGGLNLINEIQDAPADGTVIGMVVTESLGYNMRVADAGMTPDMITPITTTAGFQMAIVTRSDTGWQSFEDMMAAAEGGQTIRFGAMSPKLADLAFLLGDAQGVDFNIIEVRGGRAVMDGVNAGDMDVGFMAGIQARGVESGDLVNLASALSAPLDQTPEAPTLSDLGVPFNADGYFVFVGPAGMPDEARDALTAAITDAITREGSRSNGAITAGFGAPTVISGADLTTLITNDYEAAGALIDATSE
ncbi:MAG: tripartite tricarboxylate transporter substrate-binding protein [Pseudomonadota bacterium]